MQTIVPKPDAPEPRAFPSRPLVGVGAVVLWQDKLLLVERGRPPLAGLWSVPGGLIELGEQARAAAAREVAEETGLEVDIGELLAVVDRIERVADGRIEYHYVIVDYLARPRPSRGGAEPELTAATDARRARWVDWAELGNYALTPGLEQVLALVRR